MDMDDVTNVLLTTMRDGFAGLNRRLDEYEDRVTGHEARISVLEDARRSTGGPLDAKKLLVGVTVLGGFVIGAWEAIQPFWGAIRSLLRRLTA